MFLRDTLLEVLKDQRPLVPPDPEVARVLVASLPPVSAQAIVLKGIRRCGKSSLQAQLMRRGRTAFYCNLEDTRLFGLTPEDFPTMLAVMEELAPGGVPVFLDEVQEIPEWERLVRSLLDHGRLVCVTGSNASLLGRELGAKLTGRHLSFEVFPFNYAEYLAYTGAGVDAASLLAYLDDGGFPGYLRERSPQILRELLRDIIERDIALRHNLRETRHVMNLALFLLANTGQPFSLQNLTKSLAIPGVAQTARYLEYLQDAYLLFALPKFRCDFVTDTLAIQVCAELTPFNRAREVEGVVQACRLPGRRQALILTLNQHDRLKEFETTVEVRPVWEWLTDH